MSRPVRLGEHAAAEFAEAAQWYEEQSPGVGGKFLEAIEHALRRIEARPEVGSLLSRATRRTARRMLVGSFPYQVIYHLRDNEIVVVAIAHLKRRPGYWERRS